MREQKIKEIIACELAAFLLSEKKEPREIQITVYYPESVAKLTIDGEKLKGE